MARSLCEHHLKRARSFLEVAEWASARNDVFAREQVLQNVGYALELALKALLLQQGWTDDRCRLEIRHDLAKGLGAARVSGSAIGDSALCMLVEVLNPFYRAHRVRELAAADERLPSDLDPIRIAGRLIASVSASPM